MKSNVEKDLISFKALKITGRDHNMLSQWMWEVVKCLKEEVDNNMLDNTFWNSVIIMDRFFFNQRKKIDKNRYQVIAAASIWIACKYQGWTVFAEAFVAFSENSFTKMELCTEERNILKLINWELPSYSPIDFSDIILSVSLCGKCLKLNDLNKCTENTLEQVMTLDRISNNIANDYKLLSLYTSFQIAVAILCKKYFDFNTSLSVEQIINKGKLCEILKLTNKDIFQIKQCIKNLARKNYCS